MHEQLSLFGEENTALNTGIRHLLEMRFAAAAETLRDYSRLFTWGKDVGKEIAQAEFWIKRLGTESWDPALEKDPEGVFRIWLEFEDAFGYPWGEHGAEHKLQIAMFSRLAAAITARFDGKSHTLSCGTPIGLFFLRAGDADAAVSWLQAHIRVEPENARAYGYLGDAHMLRSDREAALACYQRAFAIDPGDVDTAHIICLELVQELRAFESEQEFECRDVAWFPALAQLNGIFKPIELKDLDQLKTWHARLDRLVDKHSKKRDLSRNPMVFYHAMVISDNASMAGCVPGLDLIEVRKTMKEIDEDLFSLHIRQLRERESKSI